eukprot:COSAG01_NODE_1838_length_9083_cov_3.184328_10_plen_84_part_00
MTGSFVGRRNVHSSLVSSFITRIPAGSRRFAICRCAALTAGRRRIQEQRRLQLVVGICLVPRTSYCTIEQRRSLAQDSDQAEQ